MLPFNALPALPPITSGGTALFLDFDGTLADLAPQPEAVVLQPGLIALLQHLAEALDGALAIVSGRPLADLDRFLAPLTLAVAAEHGALRRAASGRLSGMSGLTSLRVPDLSIATAVAEELLMQHPGLSLERKIASVALHYRQRPDLESACLLAMSKACQRSPGTQLMRGKCVVEVQPLGVSKGQALAAFMQEAPFAERTPWYAGDDLTDESAFEWVQQVGGAAVKVGSGPTLARHRLGSPAALRAWLQASAAGLRAPLPCPDSAS